MLFPITVFVIWSQNNYLSEYNPFAEIWVQTEIIAFLVNVPGQALALYIIRCQQDKIQESVHTNAVSLMKKATVLSKDLKEVDGKINYGLQSQVESNVSDETGNLVEVFGEEFKKKLEKHMKAKDVLEFEEDFFAYTVLCYTKKNTEEYLITPQKQSQNFYSALLVAFVVISMLFCMNYAILTNENGDYTPSLSHSFAVFYIKFPCAIALHFCLYPEVAKGMNLMKFANNQH